MKLSELQAVIPGISSETRLFVQGPSGDLFEAQFSLDTARSPAALIFLLGDKSDLPPLPRDVTDGSGPEENLDAFPSHPMTGGETEEAAYLTDGAPTGAANTSEATHGNARSNEPGTPNNPPGPNQPAESTPGTASEPDSGGTVEDQDNDGIPDAKDENDFSDLDEELGLPPEDIETTTTTSKPSKKK